MTTTDKTSLRADEIAEVKTTRATRIAHVISNVFSPPLLGVMGAIIAIYPTYNATTWSWVGLYMFLNIVLPTGYIFYLLWKGEVSDVHLRIRSERFKPTIVMLVMGVFACAWMIFGRAPYWLIAMAVTQLVQAVAMFTITLKWKISAHTASATGISGIGWLVLGPSGWPLLLLIPVVMWARVSIKRHTFNQTLGGLALGVISVLIALLVLPMV